MANATILTRKGQVTVPREIRDRLGLKSGDKLTFTLLSDGTVIMRAKTKRLADLAGLLTRPGQPKISVEDMNGGAQFRRATCRLTSAHRPGRVHIQRIHRMARRHEQPIPLRSAETHIGAALG